MINNFFDVLKNITYSKNPNDLGTSEYKPYMVNRYLSMHKNYFFFAELMNNNLYLLLKEYQELLLFYIIPKKWVFFKYIKSDKRKKVNGFEEIQNKFNLSNQKTNEVIAFLNRLNNARDGF